MEKVKLKLMLSGCPPKKWYDPFPMRAYLDSREYHCVVGKYSLMVLNVRGCKGLKIIKNCLPEASESLEKARELIRIHKLFFEEGIGPQVENEVVEIEFDPETLEHYLLNLQVPGYTGEQRWYGFWTETLKPRFNLFLYLYWKFEHFAAKMNKNWWISTKINNRWIRYFGINPSYLINTLIKQCYRTKYHHFIQKLKIVCLRNEIYRNGDRRNGSQYAIDELLKEQNYFYTSKGFKAFDLDIQNGIGPIVMDRGELISLIREGAQFPVRKRSTQYQDIQIKDINLIGGRSSCADRLEELGFDTTLFKNASLIDIGCNMGAFCFEAQKYGAVLTLGLDGNDEAIEAAKRLRDYAGSKNMLFFTYDLDQDLFLNIKNVFFSELLAGVAGQINFDIVFALSIVNHAKNKRGFFRQLDQMTKKLLVLEGHANETEELYQFYFSKYTHFSKVDFKGYSSDRSRRPVFFCWK